MIIEKLKNPIIRGGTAGVIGGVVMMAIDSILYSLGYRIVAKKALPLN